MKPDPVWGHLGDLMSRAPAPKKIGRVPVTEPRDSEPKRARPKPRRNGRVGPLSGTSGSGSA